MRTRNIHSFVHFKNHGNYIVETVAMNTESGELQLAYYEQENPDAVFVSTVRRFVETVSRPETGGVSAPRFSPQTNIAREWWLRSRLELHVGEETPQEVAKITLFDQYDDAAERTGKPVDLIRDEAEFVAKFDSFRKTLEMSGNTELLADFDGIWSKFHRSFNGRPPSPVAVELMVLGLGIAGEAGEVADLIKKTFGHGHALDLEKLQKEVGDNLWYASRIMRTVGRKLRDAAHGNIEKLKARYPDGFKPENSINRKPED